MSVFDERTITVQDLAVILKCSPAAIYASLHEWPHLRTAGRGIIRFREAHVEQILESMTKRPAPPEQKPVRPNVGTRANRRAR